jgi:hypothetical protein
VPALSLWGVQALRHLAYLCGSPDDDRVLASFRLSSVPVFFQILEGLRPLYNPARKRAMPPSGYLIASIDDTTALCRITWSKSDHQPSIKTQQVKDLAILEGFSF